MMFFRTRRVIRKRKLRRPFGEKYTPMRGYKRIEGFPYVQGVGVIKVTRLNGDEYWLNPHMIETMESTPDTTITLITGKKLVVKEGPEIVMEQIISYRQKLGLLSNER
jgi:flagellar protein FlbD